MRRILSLALLAGWLAGCSPPPAPDPEQRPQPQADSAAVTRDANAYKDAARAAVDATQAQAAQQAREADAQ